MSELLTLIVFVPQDYTTSVLDAVFAAGGGRVGDYERCAWSCLGRGQFVPLADSSPFVGEPDELCEIEELRCEIIVSATSAPRVAEALVAAHPYEEPVYYFLSHASGQRRKDPS